MGVTINDYAGQKPEWCPGCGNFNILAALKRALVELNIPPHKLLIVSGNGQAGKLPSYLKCNSFNSAGGRAVPIASGAKIANNDLTVIAVSGDGDYYGRGGNHWLNAIRRNHNITCMVHNNQLYALTGTVPSPTFHPAASAGSPAEYPAPALNPLALAIASDVSFAARGFSGDVEHLASLMKSAISHRGTSLLDILQPCVTFDKVHTSEWYSKRVYKLEGNYGPEDKAAALVKAQEWGERIPLGIIYLSKRPAYEDSLTVPSTTPAPKRPAATARIDKLIEEYM